MKLFFRLVWDLLVAIGRWFDAVIAIWYRPRHPPMPFIARAECTETIGYTYLCTADVLRRAFPSPENAALIPWHVETNLGSGSVLQFRGESTDGSLVYRQVGSVVIVVILPPGLVLPDHFPSRCAIAVAAAGRDAFRYE